MSELTIQELYARCAELSGERDEARRERNAAQENCLLAEEYASRTQQVVEAAQRERDEARAEVYRLKSVLTAREHESASKLRAALVAVGVMLAPCACGTGRCVRCRALRLRAEALGEDVPAADRDPTAAA